MPNAPPSISDTSAEQWLMGAPYVGPGTVPHVSGAHAYGDTSGMPMVAGMHEPDGKWLEVAYMTLLSSLAAAGAAVSIVC